MLIMCCADAKCCMNDKIRGYVSAFAAIGLLFARESVKNMYQAKVDDAK